MATPQEPTQSRKELVANQLLERAAQLFVERGVAGTSVRDIADAMGLTRPALYYYFPSKEALLKELVSGVTGVGAVEIQRLRRRTDLTATEKLTSIVRSTAEGIAQSPVRFRVLERNEAELPEAILAEHRRSKVRILDELSGIIADGVASGEFRPVNERTVAFAIIGMTNWIAWWFRDEGPNTPEEVAEEMVAMVLQGLLRHGDRAPDRDGVAGALGLIREDLAYLERILAAQGKTDAARE